ncbi:MAG: hypothetical protein GY737_02630 [Desulfobacteraceae bacterium]|nr:hypothetical protein [Desulfobacteraceae bacterium]
MNHEEIKALLNMNAVMKNLEDLVLLDSQVAEQVRDLDLAIEFSTLFGPKCSVEFKDGQCRVRPGKHDSPRIKLLCFSPAHFNRVMEGKSNPVPVKGIRYLNFLSKEFPRITDRLEFYLKPDGERLDDPDYLRVNTRFTLNTAVNAVRLLALHDPLGKFNRAHIPTGTVEFKVLPQGPSAVLSFDGDTVEVSDQPCASPSAVLLFKNEKTANDLLNGNSDAFAALATGDVMMKGRIPMIEAINLILDRIPLYLS